MSEKRHILIVNFDFPPNEGIGGRRWAKFAKQLASKEFVVHVIKADPIRNNRQSAWNSDIVHENIHVDSLTRQYPENFSHPRKDIFSKILYRIQKFNLERKEKGTIYDISIGWDKILIPKCIELIRAFEIRNVIATGAPWKMLYDVSSLKNTFPDLNIIIDYRDPWMNAVNYGMSGLSIKRRKEEERKQTFILENASHVITPYDYLTKELKEWSIQHCKNKAHFQTITHFFDPDDLKDFASPNSDNSGKINIVYGGDLYVGMDRELELLKKSIENLRSSSPELYNKVEFRIFTNKHTHLFDGMESVKIQASIGKKIFEEIHKAHACLILLPKNKKNDRTTKFFEYLPFRKPLLVIAPEGEVTEFVRENNLGFVLTHAENELADFLSELLNNKIKFSPSVNPLQYSLPAVTDQLITLLK